MIIQLLYDYTTGPTLIIGPTPATDPTPAIIKINSVFNSLLINHI